MNKLRITLSAVTVALAAANYAILSTEPQRQVSYTATPVVIEDPKKEPAKVDKTVNVVDKPVEVKSTQVRVEEQPVKEQPAQKTIREIADTMSFSPANYKEHYITCAEKYDRLYGFKDDVDGTREDAIRNFMQQRAVLKDDGKFLIINMQFEC